MIILDGVSDEIRQRYCLLRARNVSIRRAREILEAEYAEDAKIHTAQRKFPSIMSFWRFEKTENFTTLLELARAELLGEARKRGFALHGLRVNALDEQVQALEDRIAKAIETGEDKLLVELAREKRLTLAEMRQQMQPYEQGARKKESPAEKFMNSGDGKTWKKAEQGSSKILSN